MRGPRHTPRATASAWPCGTAGTPRCTCAPRTISACQRTRASTDRDGVYRKPPATVPSGAWGSARARDSVATPSSRRSMRPVSAPTPRGEPRGSPGRGTRHSLACARSVPRAPVAAEARAVPGRAGARRLSPARQRRVRANIETGRCSIRAMERGPYSDLPWRAGGAALCATMPAARARCRRNRKYSSPGAQGAVIIQ